MACQHSNSKSVCDSSFIILASVPMVDDCSMLLLVLHGVLVGGVVFGISDLLANRSE